MDYVYNGLKVSGDIIKMDGRFWDGIDRPDHHTIELGNYLQARRVAEEIFKLSDELEIKSDEKRLIRIDDLKKKLLEVQNELKKLENEK